MLQDIIMGAILLIYIIGLMAVMDVLVDAAIVCVTNSPTYLLDSKFITNVEDCQGCYNRTTAIWTLLGCIAWPVAVSLIVIKNINKNS